MTDSKQEMFWVLRAQAGDREALGLLLQAVQAALFRYIASLALSNDLAEDILQEVFVLIWRKLPSLREPELFRPWAYRITSREAFRTLRKERRWSEKTEAESPEDIATIPAPEEFEPELIQQLPQWIEAISPASRAVIVLHYLQEMTLEEVAVILEIPVGTVKSRLAYGLHCLRDQVTDWRSQCNNEQ